MRFSIVLVNLVIASTWQFQTTRNSTQGGGGEEREKGRGGGSASRMIVDQTLRRMEFVVASPLALHLRALLVIRF